MAVLIKGMEMPKSCFNCRCPRACQAINRRIDEIDRAKWFPNDNRHSDCPLIEVPEPHGRLIDADALVEDLKRQCEEVFKIDAVSPDDFWITRDQAYNERLWKTWCESFFEYLKTRETIIPESEEG